MIGLFQNETNQLCNEINRIDTMGDVNKLVTAYINPYIGEAGGDIRWTLNKATVITMAMSNWIQVNREITVFQNCARVKY